MSEPLLQLVIIQESRGPVVAARGEVDTTSAGELLAALVSLEAPVVVLDLGGVMFMDSSGIRALVAAHHKHDERGGRLVIESVPPTIRRVLRITEVDTFLHIEP